ncbi:MAG: c-type cytochrome biogenesis protein CcmI [Alphaproteobacteria bacterium]
MVFWTAGALVAVASAVLLVWPLVRPRGVGDPREHALAVYRDQLAEVDRDRERNLIDDDQARAARTEIERRLLQAARAPSGGAALARGRPLAAVVLALVVTSGALGVYLVNGDPGMPGQPLAARDLDERREERERQGRQLAELEERAREDPPASAEFWFSLGRLRAQLVDPGEAAEAFREGLARNPEDPLLMAALGEILVEAAEGTVTPAAEELFTAVREQAPNQPQALFYLGMAAAQAGDDEVALERWGRLLETGPADAPWRESVQQQFREVAERAGMDAEAMLAERQGAPSEGPAMAADMSNAEREAMIRSMVDGLVARLDENPDDVDDWLRLGRAQLVLGEPDKAIDAYGRARELAPDTPDAVMGEAEARLAAAEQIEGVPKVSDRLSTLLREVAELEPDNPQPHWYLGLHALQEGDIAGARESWRRVLDLLGPDNPSYAAVKEQIEALPRSGG